MLRLVAIDVRLQPDQQYHDDAAMIENKVEQRPLLHQHANLLGCIGWQVRPQQQLKQSDKQHGELGLKHLKEQHSL